MARQIVDGRAPTCRLSCQDGRTLAQQALDPHAQLREIDRELLAWHRRTTSPGGLQRSRASARSVRRHLPPPSPIPHQFRSGRQFAAWLGLTPLQNSSGGKERLGRISKMGDKYLRRLLVVGMTSLVRRAKYKPEAVDPRLADLLARKPVAGRTVAHGKQDGAGRLGDHGARRDLSSAHSRRWQHRRLQV